MCHWPVIPLPDLSLISPCSVFTVGAPEPHDSLASWILIWFHERHSQMFRGQDEGKKRLSFLKDPPFFLSSIDHPSVRSLAAARDSFLHPTQTEPLASLPHPAWMIQYLSTTWAAILHTPGHSVSVSSPRCKNTIDANLCTTLSSPSCPSIPSNTHVTRPPR